MAVKGLIILSTCLVFGSNAVAWEWPAEVQADYQNLEALAESGDLSDMESFILSNLGRWESLGGPWYGHLTLRAVQLLGTGAFEDRGKSRQLRRDLARTALQTPVRKTLEDEVQLTRRLLLDLTQRRTLSGWLLVRRSDAEIWLQTWKRVIDTIDPDWVRETVYLNMLPPLESGEPAGVAPEAIEDPSLRAEYEAALAANAKRAERNSEQSGARRLKERFLPEAKRYITAIYSHPPYAVDELEQLLKEYVADEQARSEILSSVTSAMEANR